MGNMPRRPDTPQSVTGRVLAILGVFTEDVAPLSLNDISRLARLPLSTTLRIISELRQGGALTRDEDRRYSLNPIWLAPRSVYAPQREASAQPAQAGP